MGFRITTNMLKSTYQYNLMKSGNRVSDALEKATTKRNFNSYAEDPVAATEAFKLRRDYYDNAGYASNNSIMASRFNSAWSAIGGIQTNLEALYIDSTIRGATDTAGASRLTLGKTLTETANSIVEGLNSQFGDRYVFGDDDALNVPFTWDEDGNLCYRGVNVNLTENDKGYEVLEMVAEGNPVYIDLGMGLKEKDGEIVSSSAFNSSINGLDALGYGIDEDGLPNNLVTILKEMGEIFSRCDSETGEYATDADRDRYQALFEKLDSAKDRLDNFHAELSTKGKYLETHQSLLKEQHDLLTEQITDIEQADLAEAFENYMWEQMCYNSALKIGSQLLGQSLLDYMN